jgi:predicted transposase YdaD
LINIVTNSNLTYPEEGDEINMCKAIEDMRAEAKAKGRAEGRAEGNTERILTDLKNVMDSINVSIEEAMEILKIDPLQRQKYAARVK